MMRRAQACAAALLAAALSAAPAAAQDACRVPEAQLTHFMTAERAKGYDLLETANGVRLQAAVFLGLVRTFRAADPARRPLWIDHARYFAAILRTTGVPAESAPAFLRVAHDHGEDVLLDYREEAVIASIEAGPSPDVAINVQAGWSGPPMSYTYEDRESDPPLRVTHLRFNAYRLLAQGDVIVYDAIEGVYGRATGGVLGAMFRVIGDGKAVRTRFVLSDDGLQVTRTTARKGPLAVTQTVTVFPDGRADRGVPRQRDDLEALEDALHAPLRVRYLPLATSAMPAAPPDDCPCVGSAELARSCTPE